MLLIVLQEFLVIDQSYPPHKSKNLGSSYGFLLLRGLEVMNQIIPIYLVSLKKIIMFLFNLLFILVCLAGITISVMQYTIKVGCGSLA